MTEHERERLLITLAADVAERRRGRGSDSQAMGRIGETIIRTWQTAHVMKQRRRERWPGSRGSHRGRLPDGRRPAR